MIKILLESMLIALLIVLILLVIILIVFLKLKDDKKSVDLKIKKVKRVLITDYIDLVEDKKVSTFEKEESFFDLLKQLDILEKSDIVEEVILDIDNLSFSLVQIEELEQKFKKLREKFKVIAIASNFNNNEYLTALLADKIYMFDSLNSDMTLLAYSTKVPYYKTLLDKIGIKVNVLHIGDYKSAGENYHLDNMSNQFRENSERLLSKIQENLISSIKNRRNIDISDKLKNGDTILIRNYQALEYGLIDGFSTLSKLIDDDDTLNLEEYISKVKKKKNKSKNKIAVISLEGTIADNENKGISHKKVKEKLEELDDEKALILRINSPGGSALESEKIYKELKELDIPIYVSMGSVCASGGYYISCVSRKVYANKNTLTGSIGVVSMYPTFEKTIDKLGINLEEISLGKGTELFDLRKELSEELKEKLIFSMKEVYKEFKLRVIRARLMSEERLEKIAGGRVWLGVEAKENGLVNDVKTFEEVVKQVQKDLNLKDVIVRNINNNVKIKDKLHALRSKFNFDEKIKEAVKMRKEIMMYEEFDIN